MNMELTDRHYPSNVEVWSCFTTYMRSCFDHGLFDPPQHRRDWRPSQKKTRLNNRRAGKFGKGKR